MTCYTDAAGSYVCPSQDPAQSTWHDLTTWVFASPLHLIFWCAACLVIGLFFKARRSQARRVVIVESEAPRTAPRTRFDEWLVKPSAPEADPVAKGPYR